MQLHNVLCNGFDISPFSLTYLMPLLGQSVTQNICQICMQYSSFTFSFIITKLITIVTKLITN